MNVGRLDLFTLLLCVVLTLRGCCPEGDSARLEVHDGDYVGPDDDVEIDLRVLIDGDDATLSYSRVDGTVHVRYRIVSREFVSEHDVPEIVD